MISNDREYRSFDFEKKDQMIVEGTPIVFNKPTVMFEIDGVKYYEVIDSRALDDTDMTDVVFVVNHTGTPAARTKNKTLELTKDPNRGLFIKADLSRSSVGPSVYNDISEGVFDKMSFAFTVRESSYDKESRTRKILKIDRLLDVSVVTFPAYKDTNISARSFFEMEIEKERHEREELRQREELYESIKNKLKGE